MDGWNNHWSIQLQNKSTGHPESGRLAFGVKAKKEKQTRRFVNQAVARCHIEAAQMSSNYWGLQSRGEKLKKNIFLSETTIWIKNSTVFIRKKLFLFHPSASWIYPKTATTGARSGGCNNTDGARVPGIQPHFPLVKKKKYLAHVPCPTSPDTLRDGWCARDNSDALPMR